MADVIDPTQEDQETKLPVDEEGDPVVDLDEVEQDPTRPFIYDPMASNLVPEFASHPVGIEALKEIADEVRDSHDADWSSAEEYRDRWGKDWRIFAGELEKKSWPYENCANVNVPIAVENTMLLITRVYGEIFNDWSNVFGVRPLGPDDDMVAEVLTLHGNWQCRTQIPDFKRQQMRGLLVFFYGGDVSSHSYWDPLRRCNRHDILTPNEFVVPFVHTSTMPDWSDVPHHSLIMLLYKADLEARRDEWYGVDEVIEGEPPGWMSEPEQVLAQEQARLAGLEIPEVNKRAPYKLLWWEGWLTLPNENRQRWCCVILDYNTQAVLKLQVYEHANWQDRVRFEMQTAERAAFEQASIMHGQMVMAHQQQTEQMAGAMAEMQGDLGPMQEQAAMMAMQAQSMAPLPPPPPMPDWMKGDPNAQPEPPRYEPLRMWRHQVCIEPLLTSLGLSHGRQQADYNRASNTLMNQFIDQMTLNNAKGFIATKDIKFEKPFTLSPGVINYATNVSAEDLKNGFIPLEVGPPNPQMVDMVGRIQQYARSSMQANEVLSGAPGKSGETFRGYAGRLEQALKTTSVQARRYLDFFEEQLKCNAFLNSIHLPEEEMMMVTNHLQQTVPIKIGRHMYERNYTVEIRADLRFTSIAQKISEADEIVQMAAKIPQLMQNPQFMLYALKKAFEVRGRYDLVQLLNQPPPPPPPQPQAGPPGAPPGAPPGGAPPGGPPQGPPPQGPQGGPPVAAPQMTQR